jgi:hypothetical protein
VTLSRPYGANSRKERPNQALQQTPAACAGSGFERLRRRGLLNFIVRPEIELNSPTKPISG